jgi:predicted ATP-dependent serine protease
MRGGFSPYGLYLIEGDPGSGKTTLALQFMMEGVRRGERCMYVTLVGRRTGAARRRSVPRLVSGRHRYLRDRPCRKTA